MRQLPLTGLYSVKIITATSVLFWVWNCGAEEENLYVVNSKIIKEAHLVRFKLYPPEIIWLRTGISHSYCGNSIGKEVLFRLSGMFWLSIWEFNATWKVWSFMFSILKFAYCDLEHITLLENSNTKKVCKTKNFTCEVKSSNCFSLVSVETFV